MTAKLPKVNLISKTGCLLEQPSWILCRVFKPHNFEPSLCLWAFWPYPRVDGNLRLGPSQRLLEIMQEIVQGCIKTYLGLISYSSQAIEMEKFPPTFNYTKDSLPLGLLSTI